MKMKIKFKQNTSKYLVALVSLLLILSAGLNVYFFKIISPANKTSNQLETFSVVKVIDGDTFDLENGERIRLALINAPEYPKGCMGIDAKARLEELVFNKTVNIEKVQKDNFGRIVALVYLDKLFVNEILVEEGLAYYEGKNIPNTNSLQIEKSQNKAQLAGRGVWSSLCQTKKEGCVIKGNYREADHTRIYHTPNCYNYDRITIKPGTSDRWFCSEEEAVRAGFRKSLDCPK